MSDGKIIDRIFADALSQMESAGAAADAGAAPGVTAPGAAPGAPGGEPREEKEQTMENDNGAPAEDLPPAGDDEEDLDALLENLTQNGEVPPAGDDADRDLDDVLDEMFPEGPAAGEAAESAPNPAGTSPLDDLMASAMDIEDMPALDDAMPEDAPAPDAAGDAAPADAGAAAAAPAGETAPGLDEGLAAMAADLETAEPPAPAPSVPDAGAAPDLAVGDGLGAGDLPASAAEDLPDDFAAAAAADIAAMAEADAPAPADDAAPLPPEPPAPAMDAAETATEPPAPIEDLPTEDLADLAAAAAAAEKEEDALAAVGDNDALAAMAAMAGDAAGTPGAEAAAPAATEPPAEEADKERLLAHLAARFDVLARRKLRNLPASQVRLIRSVNLRVDIELKFGEFSASGDDDSLFRIDE